MKKIAMICITTFVITFIVSFLFLTSKHKNENKPPEEPETPKVATADYMDFDFEMIKALNDDYSENTLISPLSIAYALNMLNEGAQGDTRTQITELLGNYKLLKNVNVENRISLANGLFIKNDYKEQVNTPFIETLKNNYSADVLFDEFKDPKVINDWASEKTYKMIKEVVKEISNDFVLGVANAIAIDVNWLTQFECDNTGSETFTLIDGKTLETAMMHETDKVTYIKSDNAQGIIKDYEEYNGIGLEYIAILPNSNIKEYINSFDKNELDTLLKNKTYPSGKIEINLALPKYTYDFDYTNFMNALKSLGMKDAFEGDKANFHNIMDNIYVSQAIHKSHIELSENGTKAAAVTFFGLDKNAMFEEEKEKIDIKFDKPFLYLIKEKNSNNIWFFGTVYEPMKIEDHKCNYSSEY